MRITCLFFSVLAVVGSWWAAPFAHADTQQFDIVVYGGTAGGVAAAVQAAKMGKSVVLVEPGRHIGGLTSGGLGATDIGNKGAIGGLSREFYARVARYYSRPEAWKQETSDEYAAKKHQGIGDTMWTFEPHVAEQILRDMLAEAKVPVVFGQRLELKGGVKKAGTRIVAFDTEQHVRFEARMFIDCTYEGDLMAKAGCSYHVGRESNATYGETLNGVQLGSKKHQFNSPVDPYRVPGDPASGLVPSIHAGPPGEHGQGEHRVQAYNFRMCMTNDPANRLPWPKPAGYDPLRYELLARYLANGRFDVIGNNQPMPNKKTDTNNNGGFSTDNIGMNYDYPDGDYATREKIWNEHIAYQQGLMWFLANDPRVPLKVREEIQRWGPARDEFVDTDNWPHQLYVREARRMISDYVMIEQNCRGSRMAPDPVGLAAYGMDSHNVHRYVKDGYASNEGDVQVHGFSPYPIAYLSIVPKANECSNLLVPICLSASHISYGSIRMEPVFMILGQSAATAACQAIDQQVAVQKIDLAKLRERLLADGQVLEWTGRKASPGVDPKSLKGIVLDDSSAKLEGEWSASSASRGYVGDQYLHDGYDKQGEPVRKAARFSLQVPRDGKYQVLIAYPALENRATNVPVTVRSADGEQTFRLNQRKPGSVDKLFEPLGVFQFSASQPGEVIISNVGADGYVIVDAVQLLPQP